MAVVVDAVIGWHLFEHGNSLIVRSLVNEEHVSPVLRILVRGGTYVKVHPPIVVDIHNSDTGIPPLWHVYMREGGYVIKPEAILIEVQGIRYLIARKKNVLQAVVVEIGDTHSPAVIDVFVGEDVEGIGFLDMVGKLNAGVRGVAQDKQGIRFLLGTGQE
jgi:hypothetical protein